MAKIKDITNKKFGRLTVIRIDERSIGTRNIKWYAKCDCGITKIYIGSSIKYGNTKSCGCLRDEKKRERKGKNNPVWKGGRITDKSKGYVRILKPNHPNRDQKGYVKEHIYIMSKHLGRKIEKDEIVHHLNGIKGDNSIENLELCTFKSHPPGQRVEDMVLFCKEILYKYKKESLNKKCVEEEEEESVKKEKRRRKINMQTM